MPLIANANIKKEDKNVGIREMYQSGSQKIPILRIRKGTPGEDIYYKDQDLFVGWVKTFEEYHYIALRPNGGLNTDLDILELYNPGDPPENPKDILDAFENKNTPEYQQKWYTYLTYGKSKYEKEMEEYQEKILAYEEFKTFILQQYGLPEDFFTSEAKNEYYDKERYTPAFFGKINDRLNHYELGFHKDNFALDDASTLFLEGKTYNKISIKKIQLEQKSQQNQKENLEQSLQELLKSIDIEKNPPNKMSFRVEDFNNDLNALKKLKEYLNESKSAFKEYINNTAPFNSFSGIIKNSNEEYYEYFLEEKLFYYDYQENKYYYRNNPLNDLTLKLKHIDVLNYELCLNKTKLIRSEWELYQLEKNKQSLFDLIYKIIKDKDNENVIQDKSFPSDYSQAEKEKIESYFTQQQYERKSNSDYKEVLKKLKDENFQEISENYENKQNEIKELNEEILKIEDSIRNENENPEENYLNELNKELITLKEEADNFRTITTLIPQEDNKCYITFDPQEYKEGKTNPFLLTILFDSFPEVKYLDGNNQEYTWEPQISESWENLSSLEQEEETFKQLLDLIDFININFIFTLGDEVFFTKTGSVVCCGLLQEYYEDQDDEKEKKEEKENGNIS